MYDFEKNQVVETLEPVDPQFHNFYEENPDADAGGFSIKDTPEVKSAVAALTGAAKALKAARTEAKGFKAKSVDLSALGAYGASPEEIAAGVQAKIEEYEAQLAKGDDAKINLDKMRTEMQAGFDKTREGDQANIETLTRNLHNLLVTNAIREAAGDDYELVAPFINPNARVVDVDGVPTAVLVDAAGDIVYNGVGAPQSIAEGVAALKVNEKTARLFASTAPKGADTKPNLTQRAVRPVAATAGSRENMTPLQLIASGLGKGEAQKGKG